MRLDAILSLRLGDGHRSVLGLTRQEGCVGSIASITGTGDTHPQAWRPLGAMVNAALTAFTVAFPHQAAFNVRVHGVSPNYIASDRSPGVSSEPLAGCQGSMRCQVAWAHVALERPKR